MPKKTKYTEGLEESHPLNAHLKDNAAGQVWSYKKKQPVKTFSHDCEDSSISLPDPEISLSHSLHRG